MHQVSDKPRIHEPRLSVILPCKGGAAMVKDCLDSLAAQDTDQPFEVLLIDGWWDDELAALTEQYPFVCLIRSDENLLQAEARNLAAGYANADYLAFIDSDCVADPGWVRGAIEALDAGVRLSGGPVVDYFPDRLICVADNFSQFAELPETRPAGVQDHFPACNIAVRREDFFLAGGFPHTGVPAGEDTLFCFAVSQRWGSDAMRFTPAQKIAHRGRETMKAFLDHQRFFGSVRAGFGIKLSERNRKLGQYRVMVLPISLLRLKFMLGRVLAWAPGRWWTLTKIMPLMLIGMWYWFAGFRAACKKPLIQTQPAFDAVPPKPAERQAQTQTQGTAP